MRGTTLSIPTPRVPPPQLQVPHAPKSHMAARSEILSQAVLETSEDIGEPSLFSMVAKGSCEWTPAA